MTTHHSRSYLDTDLPVSAFFINSHFLFNEHNFLLIVFDKMLFKIINLESPQGHIRDQKLIFLTDDKSRFTLSNTA